MSSSKPPVLPRRAVLALGGGTLLLAGCGFSPALAPGGQADGLQGVIEPNEPTDRNGFDFVAQFEQRLGIAAQPRYRLDYAIRTRAAGVGTTPSGETGRTNLFGVVNYQVIDLATELPVSSDFVETFTGYSTTRLIVSTESVERDAHERLMKILADMVVTRLMQTAPDWLRRGAPTTPGPALDL